MRKILMFIKNEAVLSVAILLAIISSFIVLPDKEYISYIDFRTLVILFVLMAIVAGLQKLGLFHKFSSFLLSKANKLYQVILVLVLLCFFLGMLITNDVVLITFVPLTFIVLDMIGKEIKASIVTTVVCMQTIAANMGSMMTPLGNPQNLYLYELSGFSFWKFMLVMFPYTLAALVVIIAWVLIYCKSGNNKINVELEIDDNNKKMDKRKLVVYFALFVVAMLSVLNFLNYWICFAVILSIILIMDRDILKKVDYSLLITFTAFFVFIGNMGRIEAFSNSIKGIVDGREIPTSVLVSQVTSNVPAALLLSGFSNQYAKLMIGINIGGLGTLIASMASLISYKIFVREVPDKKGKYVLTFTKTSIIFLVILLSLYYISSHFYI